MNAPETTLSFETKNLRLIWSQTVLAPAVSPPQRYGDRVVVALGSSVCGFDAVGGELLWRRDLGATSELFGQAGALTIAGCLVSMKASRINQDSLNFRYHREARTRLEQTRLVALDSATGDLVWQMETGTLLLADQLGIINDRLFFVDHTREKRKQIRMLNAMTGLLILVSDLHTSTVSIYALHERLLGVTPFSSSGDPGLYLFDFQEMRCAEAIESRPVFRFQPHASGFYTLCKSKGDGLSIQQRDLSFRGIGTLDTNTYDFAGDEHGLCVRRKESPQDVLSFYHASTLELQNETTMPGSDDLTMHTCNGLLCVHGLQGWWLFDGVGTPLEHFDDFSVIWGSPFFSHDERELFVVARKVKGEAKLLKFGLRPK